MQIQDKSTVVLEPMEMDVADLVADIIEEGFDLQEAVTAAIVVFAKPDPDFVAWLSDGMVRVPANE